MVDAGIAAAAAGPLVTQSFDHHDLDAALGVRRVHVIAAGKAAAPMVAAFVARCRAPFGAVLAVGSHRHLTLPAVVTWHETGHPTPDARSVVAGREALEAARAVGADETLVILLSGGASALLACPLDGITLDDKQHTGRTLMEAGADITALNTVRKHLSALKGGRLAAACRGQTLTLAVSDVVGDDLSVIGSGPGVPDATTWREALAMLARYGGLAHHRRAVVDLCERGADGAVEDTPGPGAPA
ncbi:MAG: glycerate-2-kinase family protein, partial [Vicinamibacterales bacterium]|nr:glycerate-2-kinase family protein [Vicinamibacterales bacterium]